MTARDRAESTPVARDEVGEAVGEAGPMLRTADDLRQYEREGVRLDGSMGFAWWVDGDWITATDQYFSSKALIEDYGFVFVSFVPHVTPQPDGDVREAVAEVIDRHLRDYPDIEDAHIIADAVLASGLVVPVSEVERYQRWHAEVRAECAGLRAQVAAVRAAVKRGAAGIDLTPTTRTEVSQQWLYDYIATVDQGWRERMLAALDIAPASPTTDQRIEARQLTGEHLDQRIELPDGTRGTLHALTRSNVQAVVRVDEFTHVRRHLDPADVVTLIDTPGADS